jgi:hypothetical protein
MTKTLPVLALAFMIAGAAACTTRADIEKVPIGTEVDLTRQDGGVVRGTLTARDQAAVRIGAGPASRSIPRDQIVDVQAVGQAPVTLPPAARFREYSLPERTRLAVRLNSAVTSDASRVGDPVEATLTGAVIVEGTEVLPAGSVVRGEVEAVQPSHTGKGRARVAILFSSVQVAGRDDACAITARVDLTAASSHDNDVARIVIPAAGGAILGGLLGGGKGAVIGTVIGGGVGTAVVLTTPGRQVQLPRGTALSLSLGQPTDVRVPINRM